jgi:hypothetical protein
MVHTGDCKYGGEPNELGHTWCEKLERFVPPKDEDCCEFYEPK